METSSACGGEKGEDGRHILHTHPSTHPDTPTLLEQNPCRPLRPTELVSYSLQRLVPHEVGVVDGQVGKGGDGLNPDTHLPGRRQSDERRDATGFGDEGLVSGCCVGKERRRRRRVEGMGGMGWNEWQYRHSPLTPRLARALAAWR